MFFWHRAYSSLRRPIHCEHPSVLIAIPMGVLALSIEAEKAVSLYRGGSRIRASGDFLESLLSRTFHRSVRRAGRAGRTGFAAGRRPAAASAPRKSILKGTTNWLSESGMR